MVAFGHIYAVGSGACALIAETKHTHIHFQGRIIAQKHCHARSQTDIERKRTLERTRKVKAAAVAQLGFATAKLHLHLIKKSETSAVAKADIVSESRSTIEVMAYGVEIVDIIVRFGINHYTCGINFVRWRE